MIENITAKILKGIGIAIIILGFVSSIIISGETTNEAIVIGFVVAGTISGITFIGFGEIISLLQKSVDKHDAILNYLKDKASNDKKTPKTVLQDIEDNLPAM